MDGGDRQYDCCPRSLDRRCQEIRFRRADQWWVPIGLSSRIRLIVLPKVPFSDLYDTVSGADVGFRARPVVGGHLALVRVFF